MAPSKFGSPVILNGMTGGTSGATTALPASLVNGDLIYLQIVGGSSTWFHTVSSPGVAWTLESAANNVAGILSSWFRGYVTSGSVASSTVITVGALGTDGVTPQNHRWEAEAQVWRGLDNSGTNGANATHRITFSTSTANISTITTPTVTATTVSNCVLLSGAAFARPASSLLIGNITYEGGASDAWAGTGGSASLHASAIAADLATLSVGATPGGKVFTATDTTGAAALSTPRTGWTLVLAPSPTPPTVSAAVSNTDPGTSTVLTLTGTVLTGVATSQAWTQVSGPASPTISNSTSFTAQVTPTVPGVYVFGFTATNASGTSAQATVTVYVHANDTVNAGVINVTLGTWTVLNGTTAVANLNDADATTGVQKTGTPTYTDVVTFFYPPLGPGVPTFDVDSFWTTSAVAARAKVYKADGVTLIYQDDWSPTSSNTVHQVTLNSGALAAIPALADRRALIMTVAAQ